MRDELKQRTLRFAVQIIQFSGGLPRGTEFEIIKRQLIRAATSVGANYRSACRARSRRDFISKIGIVREEADEVQYWLELLEELRRGTDSHLKSLEKEAVEIAAIMVASIKTARKNLQLKIED